MVEQSRFCTRCGAPAEMHDVFCGKCGAPMREIPTIPQLAPHPLPVASRVARSRTLPALTRARVLTAGVVVAAVACLGFFQLRHDSPGPGTFTPTGSMITPRLSTATLLPDGRVLFAGGQTNQAEGTSPPLATADKSPVFLASAELYDPSSGQFNPTGSMTTARSTLNVALADGRVLFAGGVGGSGVLASAEVYDPKTGTFSRTGSMLTARKFYAGVRLQDGRVLIAGGWDGNDNPLASAEIYDPQRGKFSRTGSMTIGRGIYTRATLLADGRVLVIGGHVSGEDLASAEIYDPVSGTFSRTGSLALPSLACAATLLVDGRVLVMGCADITSNSQASAQLFDPATSTFRPTAHAPSIGGVEGAMRLADGRVLIIGQIGSPEFYVPTSDSFVATGSSRPSLGQHPMYALLADGRGLFAGGSDAFGRLLTAAELFQP